MELISIIIPVYNIENYLPRCLETVAGQTYPNLEIILIDDGSTDTSGQICDDFARQDSRVIVIHQENQRRGTVRNSGLRIASGEFIMFVDGDDYMHTDAVRTLYDAINQGDGYDLALINFRGTNHQDEDIYSPFRDAASTELSADDLFEKIHLFSTVWAKLFRRTLLQDRWFRSYAMAQDYDFDIRAYMDVRKAVWVHQVGYYYVMRPHSAIHQFESGLQGRRWQIQVLMDNLMELTPDCHRFEQYLLREIYVYLVMLIRQTEGTDGYDTMVQECQGYERMVRRTYWRNGHISLKEKSRMTADVCFPGIIRTMKSLHK